MKQKKTVFITGCNGTLGKKLVSYFLKKKFIVIGTTRKIKKNLVRQKNFLIFKLDMLNNDDFIKLVNNLNKRKISIDTLINNSAIAAGSLTEMTSMKNLKKVFDINFFSQIKLIQNLLRFMKKSNNSSIINIGSISGLTPQKGFLSYGTSKCALMFASRIMALEFKRYNIRVNSIAPNVFKSKMANKMDKKIKIKLLNKSKAKKEIKIESIIKLIYFLSSDNSNKVNGKIIKINV